jgi:hypothetical protein
MLNEVLLYGTYGSEEYKNSNVKKLLNEWYENNFSGRGYVIEGDYDYSNYEGGYELDNLIDFDTYYIGYVGTLSVREAAIISKNTENNFLETVHGIHLMNPSGHSSSYYFRDGQVQTGNYNDYRSIRPVINIKVANLIGASGLKVPKVEPAISLVPP